MTAGNTYAIAAIRNAYEPDLQGIGRPYVAACGITAAEAAEMLDELDSDIYDTSNGEAGRPEYVIIEDDGVTDGQTLGYEDGAMYDWDQIDCTQEDDDGNKCGECQSCIEGMITQDQDMVRALSVDLFGAE